MFGFFSKKKPPKGTPAKKATAPAAKPDAAKPAAAKPEAARPAAKGVASAADPKTSGGTNLDRAKAALDKRTNVPADRKELIARALAVHQTQSKLLDRLPDETRQRLRAMALKAFVLGDKDKKKLN